MNDEFFFQKNESKNFVSDGINFFQYSNFIKMHFQYGNIDLQLKELYFIEMVY